MNQQLLELKEIIESSDNIVFFGGAGISTASGIPDFRSSEGLYSKKLSKHFSPEEAVSHTFFMRHTEEFYDFYRANLIYPEAQPNACHRELAWLEKIGKLRAIVTQNIDGLHQKAGSAAVFELHGSVHRNYCMKCHKFFDASAVLQAKQLPICDACGGLIKPDVVLYEEALDDTTVNKAVRAIAQADVLIIGGTSLVVYPAAGLIQYFNGRKVVLINKSETSADGRADLVIHEDIAGVMAEVCEAIRKGKQ